MILLIVCICFFMSASSAFAADLNQAGNNTISDAQDFETNLAVEEVNVDSDLNSYIGVSAIDEDQLNLAIADNVTGNTAGLLNGMDSQSVPATYNDLRDDLENLKDGDIYDIQKDYTIERCDYDLSKNRIININADNVVINGNGHTIDANRDKAYFAIFNITGNNVRLINLNIKGSRAYDVEYVSSGLNKYGDDYNSLTSPIEWHGDNGSISNCVFNDNTGDYGGAINWQGNNGLIENCIFDDNAARFGGALYVSGANTKISDCQFKDSYTTYHYESIYFANPKNIANVLYLDNCTFESYRMGAKDVDFENGCKVIFGIKNENDFVPSYFSELIYYLNNLKDGEVFDIVHDYYLHTFDGNIVINANNVVINGNGHKILGEDPAYSVFIVNGNNVAINNLTFDFTAEDSVCPSIIDWRGCNGVLSGCEISGNNAVNGGAVTWSGNNGVIRECIFSDNSADFGGAVTCNANNCSIDNNLFVNDVSKYAGSIYMAGMDNTISNCLFVNSTSAINGEAIFIDRNRKNMTLNNIFFDEKTSLPFIDGAKVPVDINNIVDFAYYTYMADGKIDIAPLIYNSIMKGGVIYYNDDLYYTSSYYNKSGDFVFTMVREFREYDITYTKNFQFKNIFNYTFDNVYEALRNSNFLNTFSLAKTVYVHDVPGYWDAMSNKFTSLSVFDPISGFLSADRQHSYLGEDSLSYALNVVFTESCLICCPLTWSFETSPFDILNINGCNSIIRGSFEDRNEDKWVVLKKGSIFGASDITLEGFNTVIENMGGSCMFINAHFNNNRMDYIIDRDWGAAILNAGLVTCINCSFTNNYAKNGGAIFNQGVLALANTTFAGNEAYGEGNDICVGEGGIVAIDDKNITSNTGTVYFASSLNMLESTLIGVGAAALAFIAGAVTGFFTANPAIGIAVGVLVGAALGAGASAIIISNTYDISQSRVKVLVTLMTGCALAGALGGGVGGMFGIDFFVDFLPFDYAMYYGWGEFAAWMSLNGVLGMGMVAALYNCVLM